MSVYIVTKNMPAVIDHNDQKIMIDISVNEAVFASEKDAETYIQQRKAANDRDDKGCTFKIEPWHVQSAEKLSRERAMQIAADYIANDYEAADSNYVKDILDVLGVTREEAEELGIGWIMDAENEEEK